MKFIILLIAVISLVGCGLSLPPNTTPAPGGFITVLCHDGVAYLTYNGRGITPKLHPDGTPYICVDTDTKVIIK
jgi:hypothetical protein